MKKIKRKLLLGALVLLASAPIASYAQGLDSGGEFSEPFDTSLPIDGGVSLLLVAGIGYGAKKLYDRKNDTAGEKNNNEA